MGEVTFREGRQLARLVGDAVDLLRAEGVTRVDDLSAGAQEQLVRSAKFIGPIMQRIVKLAEAAAASSIEEAEDFVRTSLAISAQDFVDQLIFGGVCSLAEDIARQAV